MFDACIVTEGAWPNQTGGLATWTNYLITALEGANIAVISLGEATNRLAPFAQASKVQEIMACLQIVSVPPARCYIASGLEAAEQLLTCRSDLASRITFVEHGDAVRESLIGVTTTEGNGRVTALGSRSRAAGNLARLHRVMRRVGTVVGVTRRTRTRAQAAGAKHAVWIPNAVLPPQISTAGNTTVQLGFVGRLTRVKGLDRYLRLAENIDVPAIVAGLPTEELGDRVMQSNGVSWNIAHKDPWMLDIGILAMPSRLEASPFSALEAESRGIPVIISDAADIVESPLISKLPWSLEHWARAIERLARHGVDRELGRRIATERWRRFATAWRRIARLSINHEKENQCV